MSLSSELEAAVKAESEFAERTSQTYDRVAEVYDDLWSPRVRGPNARLSLDLAIKPGDRLADLACGTGTETLEMARSVGRGAVVAVDYSRKMLELARLRLADSGPQVALVHARAEDFIASAAPSSFDVVSLRFALAYIDWREVLPKMAAMLKPGGRLGVLTSLTRSVPQLQQILERLGSSFDAARRLYRHWKELMRLRDSVAKAGFVSMPGDADEVAARLAAGGFREDHIEQWTETLRLYFASGEAAVYWARRSGYSTHPVLDGASPEVIEQVETLFAEGLESYRDPQGIPLDLVISGVVARKP